MFDKKIFEKYYDWEKINEIAIKINYKQDKEKTLYLNPHMLKPIYFTCGNKARNYQEAERLYEQGKAIKTTGMELFMVLLDLTENEALILGFGYDLRTKQYLNKVLENIGFMEEINGYDGLKFKVIKQYDIWKNLTGSGYVDIGELGDRKYVAEFCYKTDVDDYNITDYIFNRYPTRYMVEIVHLVRDIEYYFFMNKGSYEFTCQECGRKTHWLDYEDNLKGKFEVLKNRYCGC